MGKLDRTEDQRTQESATEEVKRAESLLRAGRNMALNGRAGRARAYYQQVAADFAGTPFADEARQRLLSLGE